MNFRKTMDKIKPYISLLLIATIVSVSMPTLYSAGFDDDSLDYCKLSIVKSSDIATVAPNGNVVFTINFTNIGARDCTGSGVLIQDVVDNNLEFISESHSSEVLTFGYNDHFDFLPYDPATKTLSWNADIISPGETGWVSWTGKALDPETCGTYDIFNTAKMSSHEYSEFTEWENSNMVKVSLEKECADPCDLSIIKSANVATVAPNGNVVFTINFTNIGGEDCTGSGVLIQDVVDNNLEFISESHSSEVLTFGYNDSPLYFPDYDQATRTLSWNADVITPGETGWVSWTGKALDPETCGTYDIFNTAKMTSHEYSPSFDQGIFVWKNSNTVEVSLVKPCAAPAIKIIKEANPTSLPSGGGNVNYSYAVTNTGNVALTNIVLSDDKCSPVNYISGDANSNDQLETTETWNYACSKNITAVTTNIATVAGKYNATDVSDTDSATVTINPPATCVSGCGGGGSLFPAIRLIKTPAPYQLPKEGGSVIYTYLVSNPGYYTITDVVLTDDKCSELKFIDGDKNTDKKLDRSEIWKYACQTSLTETTINTAIVNGKSSAGSVTDTTKATVYVPKMDLAIKLEKTANPESLSEKGDLVTYSYKVSNKGSKAISDITLTDDKCSLVNFISGDINKDKKLDTAETWLYTCQANIIKTTINTGTARGQVDGKYATDTSSATVRVGKVLGTSIIPKGMPKTGFGGGENISISLGQMLSSVFILLAIANVEPRKKYN